MELMGDRIESCHPQDMGCAVPLEPLRTDSSPQILRSELEEVEQRCHENCER